MIFQRFCRPCLWALCLLLAAASGAAQTPADPEAYKPSLGVAGKDVFWVPTPQVLAQRMLELAGVSERDYVIDLGSGDGRIVIEAAKRGARALGIEYNPDMVAYSRRVAEKEGVGDRARFLQGDIFANDFSPATVLTLFLLPELNLRLRPLILKMRPGTRIVSHYFDMGEWMPDERLIVTPAEGCPQMHCEGLLWVVPAQVEGRWQMPRGELTLTQAFQTLSGFLTDGGATISLAGGRLAGDEISFWIGSERYQGRVEGGVIRGTVQRAGETAPWEARTVK
jgi:SAM-dependent methyltransferase